MLPDSADVSCSNLGPLLRKSAGSTVPIPSPATVTSTDYLSVSRMAATAVSAYQHGSAPEASETVNLPQLSADFLALQRRSYDHPEVSQSVGRSVTAVSPCYAVPMHLLDVPCPVQFVPIF